MPRTAVAEGTRRRRRPSRASSTAAEASLHGSPTPARSQSLLDVVDSVIDKGLALDAELVLGLADIDLIYLRAGALVAAADRVFPRRQEVNRRSRITHRATPMPSSQSMARAAHRGQASTALARRSHQPLVADASAGTPAGDATSRSVIRLVLTLVEFVRELLERQAVRRVREQTLTPDEVERLGTALMRLEATIHELAERHGLDVDDLNLDLGPLGTLR